MSADPYAAAENALSSHGVPASVLPVALQMIECIREAADDVANDTGDDRYDDANGRGHLRYRRARRRMIEAFDDEDESVAADNSNNSLVVMVDDIPVSFYSAPNGVDQPQIGEQTRTRRLVVSEMQLQLKLDDAVTAPRRLVLIHECDEEGLLQAALGVLKSSSEWAWQVLLYDRLGDSPALAIPDDANVPSYEDQEEAQLPPSELRDDIAAEDRDVDKRP